METYAYTGSGGLALGGRSDHFFYRFSVNQYAYALFGEKQGRLQKICIKKIFFNRISAELVVVYQDTFNEIWLESELFASPVV